MVSRRPAAALVLLALALACSGSAVGDDAVGLVTGTYYYAHRVAVYQAEIAQDQLPVLVSHAGLVYALAANASQAANDTAANGTGAATDAPVLAQGAAQQALDQANATLGEANALGGEEQGWLADAQQGLRGRLYATEHYANNVWHATWSRL